MEEIGLYNIFEQRLQHQDLPRTHARGSKAIDHIWVTHHILDNTSYAGYSPFGHIWDSDHRALFIDIKDTIFFREDDIKIVYSDFRRLKSSIPKRTKKYIEVVTKNWNYHNIDSKFDTLINLSYTDDPAYFEQTINKLDQQITEIMVGAGKKCTKVRSHHLDEWSPEMMEALEFKRHKKHC